MSEINNFLRQFNSYINNMKSNVEELTFIIEESILTINHIVSNQDPIYMEACLRIYYIEHFLAIKNLSHSFNKKEYTTKIEYQEEYFKTQFLKRLYNETSLNYCKFSFDDTPLLKMSKINRSNFSPLFGYSHTINKTDTFLSQLFELNIKEHDLSHPYQIFLEIREYFNTHPDYNFHPLIKVKILDTLVFDRQELQKQNL